MSKELSVLVENRPGSLGEVASILAEEGVNIEAIMLEGSLDFGVARMRVDNPRVAETALNSRGFPKVTVGEVLQLDLPNEPGKLAEICHRLSEVGVNIEYIFGTAGDVDDGAELVVKADDMDRAREAVEEYTEE
jgi:hypothetical protein